MYTNVVAHDYMINITEIIIENILIYSIYMTYMHIKPAIL